MRFLAAFLVLFSVGCSHTINLREYGAKNAGPDLKSKKIAVILDRVPDDTDSSIGPDRYEFRNMKEGVKSAVNQLLVPVANQVVVVSSDQMPANFDYYVYPELTVRVVNDFWTVGCLIKFKASVIDKSRSQVGADSKEFKRSFFFPSQAQGSCNDAMNEIFADVISNSLKQASR